MKTSSYWVDALNKYTSEHRPPGKAQKAQSTLVYRLAMELPTTIASWYATAMSLLISSILLGLSIYHFLRVFDSVIKFLILKYLIYPSISLLKPAGIRLNYLDVGIALLFLCANGTCLAWRTESVDDLSSRSASLLVTNCILLLPGASITADGLRISLETHRKAHVAVGTISFLQCLVHVVIELAVRSWPGNARSLWGVVVRIVSFFSRSLHV